MYSPIYRQLSPEDQTVGKSSEKICAGKKIHNAFQKLERKFSCFCEMHSEKIGKKIELHC